MKCCSSSNFKFVSSQREKKIKHPSTFHFQWNLYFKTESMVNSFTCKQSFELFSCSCRLIKEEEVKKWKEQADKMKKGKFYTKCLSLLLDDCPPETGLARPLT